LIKNHNVNVRRVTMRKQRILGIFVIVCIAALLVVFSVAETLAAEKESPITLKLALFHPAAADCTKIWRTYESKFATLTHGRVLLKVFDSGTLAKGSQHMDACQRNVADLAFSWPAYQGRTFPVCDIQSVPLLFRDKKGAADAYNFGVAKLIEEDYASHGMNNVMVISFLQFGNYYILTKDKQLKVPGDIEGLKMRASGGGQAAFFKACGAGPVSFGVGGLYEGMQRGIVSGSFVTAGNIKDYKLYEVGNYLLNKPILQAPFQLIGSKKSIANIPNDLRPLVLELLRSATIAIEADRSRTDDYVLTTLAPSNGVKSYTPTKEEVALWTEKGKSVLDSWLKRAGDRGVRALEIVRKYNK
jgi:TRAP-type C4-dicarboxylate transport system substrate-binding protein